MKLHSKLIACFSALFMGCLAHAQLNFTDTEMFDSNWSIDEFVLQGTGSVGETNIAAGNPGNARRIFNNMGNSSGIAGIHLHDQAVMTIQSGGLASLAMSLDALTENRVMAIGFVVKQDNKFFVADYGTTALISWQTWSNTNLQATDFAEVTFTPGMSFNTASNPDFTLVGSQLQFGYLTANSSLNSVTVVGDFDNFSVQAVPEPATMTLLALPALAAMRKRKRS